ncbi:hypothetical protein LTR84_007616 [Exophiala bonariae]|uniref:VOC domain-containing protein n=1 Tax=Exophiala bonariae TaxID=1690606 RepID=A0AAV9NKY0_9EURO|nr:hypothetical protein LTR84_007616 [Exophiala bonariae]
MAMISPEATVNGINSSNGKLIAPEKIAHFGLRTTPENFEKMVDWHLKFFAGKVVLKTDHAAFIRFDDEHHRIVIIADQGHQQPPDKRAACGIYHISFALNTLEQLATSYEQKKNQGIVPHWPVNHGISTSMYYFDPDRNEFEFQVDNFDTAEEAHAFMATDEFALNPIGVDFVPEDFVQRVRSGSETDQELKRRPIIGKRGTRWENSLFFKEENKWDN